MSRSSLSSSQAASSLPAGEAGEAAPATLHVARSGPATPSKVRFEVDSLRRLRFITEEEKQGLLASASVEHQAGHGRQQHQEVTRRVLAACAQIREAKSRVDVGLLDPSEFRDERQRLVDEVRRSAAPAGRRGHSYTRQIMATVAQRQQEQRERQQEQRERRHQQEQAAGTGGTREGEGREGLRPGLVGEGSNSSEDFGLLGLGNRDGDDDGGGGGSRTTTTASSGSDDAYDASVEFLREMGVELSNDEVPLPAAAPAGVPAAGADSLPPSTGDGLFEHARPSSEVDPGPDPDPDLEPEPENAAAFRRGDRVRVRVRGTARPESEGFKWNGLKRDKVGAVGVVVNTDAEQDSVQLRFADELRFWFPTTLVARQSRSTSVGTAAPKGCGTTEDGVGAGAGAKAEGARERGSSGAGVDQGTSPSAAAAAAGGGGAADVKGRQQQPVDRDTVHDGRSSGQDGKHGAASWTPSAVAHFVQQLGRKRLWTTYAQALLREEVDGTTLRAAEAEDLVEYGVSRLHAKKILARFRQAVRDEVATGAQDEGAIFKYLRTADKSVAYLEQVIGQVSADTQVQLREAEEGYTRALEELNAAFQAKVVGIRDGAQLRLGALQSLRKMVTSTVGECESLWGLLKASAGGGGTGGGGGTRSGLATPAAGGRGCGGGVSVAADVLQAKIETTLQRVRQLSNEQILKRVASIQAQ